jgi:cytochrome bd-type quinol oxidase subunit 2
VPADGGESYAGSGDCESGAVSKCERAGRLDERAWGRGDWSAMIPFLAIFSFLGVLEERGSSRSGAMRAWISYLDEVLACVLVCFAWLMRCGAVRCSAMRISFIRSLSVHFLFLSPCLRSNYPDLLLKKERR